MVRCDKCGGEMVRDDDVSLDVKALACIKCGKRIYVDYPIDVEKAKAELKEEHFESKEQPIYCQDCMDKGVRKLIGYVNPKVHPTNRKRYCFECKRARARAQEKIYSLKKKAKKQAAKLKQTEEASTL